MAVTNYLKKINLKEEMHILAHILELSVPWAGSTALRILVRKNIKVRREW